MSLASLEHVIARIAGAPPHSAISVYRTREPGQLDAKFSRTVVSQAHIRHGHGQLIGSFWGLGRPWGELQEIEEELRRHVLPGLEEAEAA